MLCCSVDTEQSAGMDESPWYIGQLVSIFHRSLVLNSCIKVSDYNKPYSLCQPLLPLPLSTLGLTRAKPFGIPTTLHYPILSLSLSTYLYYLSYLSLFLLIYTISLISLSTYIADRRSNKRNSCFV